ncbi:MAG: class I SAM-dependent methyltransferase [Candidatus Bathyarchaeia archaeon]|jgi:demethylmenaquinone methyltransferase/2-methoxy-6-polyprenyl-1,4-benzoquinol methylase
MNPTSINPKQKDFFNEKAKVWDQITIHNPKKVQYIAELLEIQGSNKILDVGTGTGVMIPFYEKYLADGYVVAVDYSEKMIEVAQSKYPLKDHPRVKFLVADVTDLKYDGEFDLVVCYSCFPHFIDKSAALKILARALKKGGRLAVAHSDSAKKINGVHMSGGVEICNDFLPSMENLKQLMKENGLTVTFERDDQNYFICIAKKA